MEASDDTVYVFLDIDGMLCPKCSDDLAESSQGWAQGWAKAFDPQCLALFERVVLSHSHVRVVISSSWRKKHSLDGLRRMFNEAVAERVVGVTPELEPTTRHFRYNEVLLYFKQNRIPNPRWVAVEDDDEHFPAGSPVVLTDSETGFGGHSAGQLSLFLNPD